MGHVATVARIVPQPTRCCGLMDCRAVDQNACVASPLRALEAAPLLEKFVRVHGPLIDHLRFWVQIIGQTLFLPCVQLFGVPGVRHRFPERFSQELESEP